MFPKSIAASSLAVSLLAGANPAQAVESAYRQPLGVYAHVYVDDAITAYKNSPEHTQEDVHTYLRNVYGAMFENNFGLAGITFGIHWDRIQKNDPDCAFSHDCLAGTDANGNDWSYVDDVFAEAHAFRKTVQLIITPGVDSPSWVFNRLLPSCDSLFGAGDNSIVDNNSIRDCGRVTFSLFPEQQRADGNVIPLPWSTIYQSWWQRFLSEVNERYGSDKDFVAIAIAGPICASTEMILPTSLDGSLQSPGVKADEAWSRLIQNSFPLSTFEYQHSDQVFVEQWETAIATYEGIFKTVTLFLSPDSGNKLPEFGVKSAAGDSGWLFVDDCSEAANYPLSCEAKTQVLTYFLATEDGLQLATQVGGLAASSPLTPGSLGIGIGGVKLLASLTTQSPRILGGAEFDKSVSTNNLATRQQEGCKEWPTITTACETISVEKAAYNALAAFFAGTAFATRYGATKNGGAPLQWVELDYTDVAWAQLNASTPDNGTPCNQSLQDLIDGASWYLFTIASKTPQVPEPTCK